MFDHVNQKRRTATIIWEDDECEEYHTEVPIVFEVCPECGGSGTHCNRNIDGNGLTAEDFAEDPDFAEDYFAGNYDVICEMCDGLRVYPTLDPKAKLSEEQSQAVAFMEQRAYDEAMDRRTQRMECGGY